MIVLSRKKNESIIIGDDITVTIVEIRGDKVRLGIEHPRDIPVHRQEVWEAIRRATTSDPLIDAPPPQTSTPQPHFAQRQPDQVDRLAAALQSRLLVSVNRDLVAAAMAEAGMPFPAAQMPSTPR